MLLWVWAATLATELLLLVLLLRQDRLPWFTVWMSVNWAASMIEMIGRNHGWFYDPFWRCTEIALMLLLFPVVAECSLDIDPATIHRTVLLSLSVAVIVHAFLHFPLRWPDSYLEVIIGFIALIQLLLGLFLVQICIYGSRYQRHACVLASYMLATSACYYAASSFPTTIGIAEIGVEFIAAMAWLAMMVRMRTDSA